MEWISVEEMLPEDGCKVVAYFRNSHGRHRRIMAYHASRFTIKGSDEDEFEASEYCEEKDEYFLREGWYENNEFEEVNWFVCAHVTHWMPLPEAPK